MSVKAEGAIVGVNRGAGIETLKHLYYFQLSKTIVITSHI